MAITFVGAATAHSTAAVTSLACTVPTVQDGDYLLCFAAWTINSGTWSLPGWTQDAAADVRAGTASLRLAMFRKSAVAATDSGATATVSSGASGMATVVIRAYRGVDPLNPLDVSFTSASTASSDTTATAVPAPAVTPATDGAMLVTAHAQPSTAGTTFTNWTAPTGMGDMAADCSVSSSNNAALGTFDELLGVGTAGVLQGPFTATSPQARKWVAFSVLLRAYSPAVGGPLPGRWGMHL